MTTSSPRRRTPFAALRACQTAIRFAVLSCSIWLGSLPSLADVQPDPSVSRTEQERVEVMARASAAALAIFEASGQGGGSGVIISPDGFALTNFHVVAPCGPSLKCGMSDGQLYDAVVVGVDPVGDVALIQLLGRGDFPTATIGDSDKVRVGDWVFAAGNPFLLADDFQPSISYGMISGVHRYQYPSGTLLEYADCLQTDAAINPGNSGGALFDSEGNLIGINGRASFEKRGRVNVGVGYAISINQIMRFLTHLKSGRIVDHASLGFTVTTAEYGRVVVDDILETSDAFRRGLRYGDRILQFAGREIRTANALQTALGTYPRDWIVPLSYSREGREYQVQLRLPGVHDPAELVDLIQRPIEDPSMPPEGAPRDKDEHKEPGGHPNLKDLLPHAEELPASVRERYQQTRGYANYWYNEQAQDRLWNGYLEHNNLNKSGNRWKLTGSLARGGAFEILIDRKQAEMRTPTGQFGALFAGDLETQISPPGSGGLLLGLHLWQRLLEKGVQKFGEVYYLGQLPTAASGEMAECLVGIYGGIECRLFFSPRDGNLVALQVFSSDNSDPCEIQLSEPTEFAGNWFPAHWSIRCGDSYYADLTVESWTIDNAPATTTGGTN